MSSELVLLTDLDNTLYNWIDYFAPSFRAMVHALAHATKLEEDEIYQQFLEVYTRFGIAEYRHAMQELRVYQSESPEVRSRLLRAGYVAFSRTRGRRLHAYPSVPSTLQWLKQQGIIVIGVTNSWVVDAVVRVRQLGLSRYFDALVAWDGSHAMGGQPVTFLKRPTVRKIVPVSNEHRKPSAEGYRAAMACVGVGTHARVWVIGDSMRSDLIPAQELGITTIWARYGQNCDPLNFKTILRITHWEPDKVKSAYDTTIMEPDYCIDDFAQLRLIIPAVQDELFPEYVPPLPPKGACSDKPSPK